MLSSLVLGDHLPLCPNTKQIELRADEIISLMDPAAYAAED